MKSFQYCKIACLVYVDAVSFVAIICVYVWVSSIPKVGIDLTN